MSRPVAGKLQRAGPSTKLPSLRSAKDLRADLAAPIRDLDKVIRAALPAAAANLYGGAKVRLVLYSIGDANNVICGISPGSTDACSICSTSRRSILRFSKLRGNTPATFDRRS